MIRVFTRTGSIAGLDVQAIVCPVGPFGPGDSPTAQVIRKAAGNQFHVQLAVHLFTTQTFDTQVVQAKRTDTSGEKFPDVLFMLDFGDYPVPFLTLKALHAAARHGYRSVAIPLIRGRLDKMLIACKTFDAARPRPIMDIYMVEEGLEDRLVYFS